MTKNKFYKINVWFLVSAFSILVGIVLVLVFSFRFLSATLMHSLSAGPTDTKPLSFDIERAKNLER